MPIESGQDYNKITGATNGGNFSPQVGTFYSSNPVEFAPPKSVEYTNSEGTRSTVTGVTREATPSLFNRYSIFFFNSQLSNATKPENYFDGVNRLGSDELTLRTMKDPTISNIIQWSRNGNNNAIDYAWEDFLWCSDVNTIPNNYLITMRRFPIPVMDDLSDRKRNPSPDIGRMITWMDGETNKWESCGLKWSHGMEWKPLTSEIQKIDLGNESFAGNESGAFNGLLGSVIKSASWATQPGAARADLANPNEAQFNPYENSNVVYGPVDIIKEMMIRDVGLKFEQEINLTFKYTLQSYDGINTKVAFIDLLSNILICTMNRGAFWGGEIRYFGADPRRIRPIGDTSRLAKGDYAGYITSLVEGIVGRLDNLTGGNGLTLSGIANAAKTLGSNLIANIVGGALDKMGRPSVIALNSLLSGEDTGEWHVTIGNPANPIISLGNLILEDTTIEFGGQLSHDDFPTQLTVTCKLKPARPRDRTDIIAMFHKNGRTYLTNPPSVTKYTGNLPKGGKNGGFIPKGQERNEQFNVNSIKGIDIDLLKTRFPNHANEGALVKESARGIF